MGLYFVSENDDFSANPVGHAGIYTSITTGLLALFETRRSVAKAINNSAPGGASGSVVGAPVFSAASAAVTLANYVQFPTAPVNGSQTFAVVVKKKAGGAAADIAVGAFSAAAATVGSSYFTMYNFRLSFVSTSFPIGTVPPLSGSSNLSAVIDTDAVAEFELFIGVLESNVSVRLYRPKTGAVVTTPAVGRNFLYDNPPRFRATPGGTATQDVALFSQWNRALTPLEIATFYAEIKPQLAKSGISI